MKKVILGLAVMAAVLVSCKDETKDKVEETTEAVGAEVEQKMDTAAAKIDFLVLVFLCFFVFFCGYSFFN